jgi:polygalacturonase
MIARALTHLRLSSREPPPLATLGGPDLYFRSPEPISPPLAQLAMCSMAEGPDGKGGNGGVMKPKFFYAHSLTTSSITDLNINNTPVQTISIDGANSLTLDRIIIDNSVGGNILGHNTDAFDVGDSTGVTISGADVKSQDDCLAINSSTVSSSSDPYQQYITSHTSGHNFHRRHMLWRTRSVHWLCWRPL